MASPHEQLLLWDRHELDALGAREPADAIDVSFLHKSFCVAGLPLRAPRQPMKPWTRNDEHFALTVNPNAYPPTYSTGTGPRTLRPETHGALIRALARGPRTLEELGGMPVLDDLSVLVATDYVWPCPSEESIDDDRVSRLNMAVGRSLADGGSFGSSLTPRLIRPTLPIWWHGNS